MCSSVHLRCVQIVNCADYNFSCTLRVVVKVAVVDIFTGTSNIIRDVQLNKMAYIVHLKTSIKGRRKHHQTHHIYVHQLYTVLIVLGPHWHPVFGTPLTASSPCNALVCAKCIIMWLTTSGSTLCRCGKSPCLPQK